MPHKQFKKIRITVYLNQLEKARLDATAILHQTTTSEWVRAVLLEHGLAPETILLKQTQTHDAIATSFTGAARQRLDVEDKLPQFGIFDTLDDDEASK